MNELYEEVKIIIPKWNKVPVGTIVIADIADKKSVECRVQKEDRGIFLCQDKVAGSNCYNKLGFKYSYSICEGTMDDLHEQEVSIKEIKKDPTFHVAKDFKIAGRYVVIKKDEIEVGCTKVKKKVIQDILKEMEKL